VEGYHVMSDIIALAKIEELFSCEDSDEAPARRLAASTAFSLPGHDLGASHFS
jgi:hypothetical protein